MSTELSADLKQAVEAVVDGWYSEGRIDWEDFIDRVEAYTDIDLGNSMVSAQINAIKVYARKYRAAG